IKLLDEKGLLVKRVDITHSYPHCWRCKEPIAFRATNQWFINIDHEGLRGKLIKYLDTIQWVPRAGYERMKYMILQRPDWCLSRQRLWGIPIPAVKCADCGEVELSAEVIANVEKVVKTKGVDCWFSDDIKNFLPENFKCAKCGSMNFTAEKDILDVWFESGASFDAVVKKRDGLSFPADMYLEGSDQHRGWFQVSLILAVCKEACSPFKTLLTHGFVVDAAGKKMSKSLGNVISPQDIVKQYGAEIIRLWAAYSDYTEDVRLSDEIIKQLVDMYRKIRNTIRFLLGNLYGFDTKDAVGYEELLEVDKYMFDKANEYFSEITGLYNENRFYRVCQKLFDYCNIELSSFYLDILKDRLYTYPKDSAGRNSALTVLYYVLQELLKLIAPILSYTAEEAYSYFDNLNDKKESIFLEKFSGNYGSYRKDCIANWERILILRDKVLKELENNRVNGLIGSSLDALVIINAGDDDYDFIKKYEKVFPEIFIVSQVKIEKGDFNITVKKAHGIKCARCWNWSTEISVSGAEEDICPRCKAALKSS
ncbi:MAG: class I tRNA ligase family protein, partial [Candidatus Omnitrophica bacterium]|nr:class I tRNA ligase family protein [Candidatus Omnitrophota bacterium]